MVSVQHCTVSDNGNLYAKFVGRHQAILPHKYKTFKRKHRSPRRAACPVICNLECYRWLIIWICAGARTASSLLERSGPEEHYSPPDPWGPHASRSLKGAPPKLVPAFFCLCHPPKMHPCSQQ